MKRDAAAFLSGAIFSAGLCLSGMTRPSKVLAFLDFTGAWDPSLALVMVGAIAVTAIAIRVTSRWASPLFAGEFRVPSRTAPIDSTLLIGAAVFGVGWGLSGLCPGPVVVSLASGQAGAFVFVVAMFVGSAIPRASVFSRVILGTRGRVTGTAG